MKKLFLFILAAVLCLSVAACGGASDGGHTCSGEWQILEDATCLKEGSRQRTCASCGQTTTEVIPVLTHIYEEGICTLCNSADPNYKPAATAGLLFESFGNGTCAVVGIETMDTDVVVPEVSPDGDRVVAIGNYAFHYCDWITSIWIPDSVQSIGEAAFYGCSSLTKAVLGNGVKEIGYTAFSSCKKLTTLSMSNSITTIGDTAFYGCAALTQVNLPQTLTTLGGSAFQQCASLTEITIPDSVTEIKDYTFMDCTGLQKVVLGNAVKTIGSSAFRKCTSLTQVTMPASLTKASERVFQDCTALEKVYINDLKAWLDISFSTYNSNPVTQGCDVYLNNQLLTELVIPKGTTTVRDHFNGCTSLVSVTIPDSVEKISSDAFRNCTNLTTVNMGEGVKTIGRNAFNGCSSLAEFTLPATITNVESSNAFGGCTGLKKLTINTPYVFMYVFYECTALEEVVVPASLASEYYSEVSWQGHENLLKFDGDPGEISRPTSEGLEFTSNKNGTCRVTGIGTCTDAVIVIPDTAPNGDKVVAIAGGAFERCSSIRGVVIPDTVKEIGAYAFHYCSSLQSLDLPESVTVLGSGALNNCPNLATLTIRSKTLVYSPYYNNPHDDGAIPTISALYVPAELVETYKSTINWIPLGDKIQPIEE